MSEEQLMVRRIRQGTVIDHIEAGQALEVLRVLGIKAGEGGSITIALNVPSTKLGKKDIVKMEGRFLAPEEANKIALIAPRATINLVRDFRVVEKRRVELPPSFRGLFHCPNPTCITNAGEPITPIIDVVQRSPPLLRCRYCSRLLEVSEVW